MPIETLRYDHTMHGTRSSDLMNARKRKSAFQDEHCMKKRVIDIFSSLNIDDKAPSSFEGQANRRPNGSPEFLYDRSSNVYDNGEKVVIRDIDQFLRDNPDESISQYQKIKPDQKVEAGKLYIPKVELNEIFNEASQKCNQKFLDAKKREIEEKIYAQRLRRNLYSQDPDGMVDEEPIEISKEELYYELYLARFWSLLKYKHRYNVILDHYKAWCKREKMRNDAIRNNRQHKYKDDHIHDINEDDMFDESDVIRPTGIVLEEDDEVPLQRPQQEIECGDQMEIDMEL
ncbi:Hypothetical protein PAS_chr3_1008 [Komagataella phaffii GS115]|uniref:Uncharacterized protein n=2 Tax=Komagataella phaffii TaxID=460519 RepID=C4R683_KOMPG|nr:Hypothetical protein PAS_chr3_1008 [Komagataella phaffii GS115]AOA64152.1 GQ67_04138T0 [Komagataella phaffii]AOA69139.1 GQ68_04111T0 [Komagataella phaffii GS115]CAY71069.1 Hypothetical protein PAS_chr3_1008 [Komagataella phaffii GS115]